jgi:hypothetical protein
VDEEMIKKTFEGTCFRSGGHVYMRLEVPLNIPHKFKTVKFYGDADDVISQAS